MLVVACISSHGFGHGARVAALLRALARRRTDCRFVLSTALPAKFLNQIFAGLDYELRPCQWDVGVVQQDALGCDPRRTLDALEELERRLPQQLVRETNWLEHWRQPGEPSLILGDVPPAAACLASLLGWPLIWQANFGWDDIYGAIGGPLEDWAHQSLGLYRQGLALIRCPFSLPMPWGLEECRVGLTASEPRSDLKKLSGGIDLNWSRSRRALVTFGGFKLPISPSILECWPDWQFFVVNESLARAANAVLLPEDFRPVDVMPLCSVVITKPGYSTFAEALSQNCSLIVVERHGFAEADVLQKGLQQHGFHRLLSRLAFEQGQWQLEQPLSAPLGQPLPTDGADAASQFVLAALSQSR